MTTTASIAAAIAVVGALVAAALLLARAPAEPARAGADFPEGALA